MVVAQSVSEIDAQQCILTPLCLRINSALHGWIFGMLETEPQGFPWGTTGRVSRSRL